MELPKELKDLYRHWQLHTRKPEGGNVFRDSSLKAEVMAFVNERISIWKKKAQGEALPYTKDPILSTYRFCNIFREFDKQTIFFHTLLNPLRDNFPLWLLNMFYCRMIARPETIENVGLLSFDSAENKIFYKQLMGTPRPRFGTPYVFPISVILRSATPTRESFIAHYLPSIMGKIAEEIQTWEKVSVVEGIQKLLPMFNYNLSFLWTEVLIDVAYQFPERIDLYKQFPVGPGSLPTMKRIDTSADPTMLVVALSNTSFDTGITYEGNPLTLSAENWEGIGCEFRKYSNLKNGKGRKRRYR